MKIIQITAILILFVATLAGCNKKEEVNERSELEPLSHTIYSQHSELFVEYKPLVVGSTSKFAAHFTVLGENFTALTDAKVTVSLIVNSNGIKNSVESPSAPGIFRLALTPKTAGTGTLVFDIHAKNFTNKITIENVIVYPNEKSALSQQPEQAEIGDISYLKEQAWKIEFANQKIIKRDFANVIKTGGQLLSAPGDEMIVTAKASGVVVFSGKNAIVGSAVNSGSRLFTISGGDITQGNLDAAVQESKANFLKAKTDFERSKDLNADKIISDREFQQVKLQYDNARLSYNTIAKNYTSKGLNILSPMTGFIKSIMVTEGQFVQSGTPLATISKNKKLLLQANVSQNDFNKMSAITSANFKSAETGKIFNTSELNGKMISYGRSALANSPFIPITFEIDNTTQLISGSGVEVYLKSTVIPDALVVPVSALVEEQGNFYVYVQTGGESFQKREVKLGGSDGLNVQILSGIDQNERVVTKGAYQIKLATASGSLPAHGHEH